MPRLKYTASGAELIDRFCGFGRREEYSTGFLITGEVAADRRQTEGFLRILDETLRLSGFKSQYGSFELKKNSRLNEYAQHTAHKEFGLFAVPMPRGSGGEGWTAIVDITFRTLDGGLLAPRFDSADHYVLRLALSRWYNREKWIDQALSDEA